MRRGFTIVEAALSTVIVAVMFVAVLNTVGASMSVQWRTATIGRGRLFAQMFLSEILLQSYQDSTSPVFGVESGESTTTRADFDDVDDYSGWSGVPTAKDGTALPNSSGWTQTVTVEWVDRLNPSTVVGSESGAKRITIVTKCNNVPQVTLVALRTAR
ncbi:MAG: type II secretion system protein [Sedimentisphaerales bacterium]|nr:type II secretion system protein [Sedimentisphaerales bacterium]